MSTFFRILAGVLASAPAFLYAQWQTVVVPSDASFRSVHVADDTHVWVAGTGGTVLKSRDGGLTFQVVSPPESDSLDFRSVYGFKGGRRAVAMSICEAEKGHAKIYHTEDGGKSWNLAFSTNRQGVFLNCVAFWDEQNGLCMGDPIDGYFYLLRTKDGGKSWSEVPVTMTPQAKNEKEIAFAASGSTLFLGKTGAAYIGTGGEEGSRVFRSFDFGKTWSVSPTPIAGGSTSGVFGMLFYKNQGVILGGDYKDFKGDFTNIAYSDDAGKTWYGSKIPPKGLKESAAIAAGNKLVVVGHSGSSYSGDGGKSWTVIDELPYHAVSSSGKTTVAVGIRGLVKKFNLK